MNKNDLIKVMKIALELLEKGNCDKAEGVLRITIKQEEEWIYNQWISISKYLTVTQVVNQRELNEYLSKENKQTSYEKLAPWGNCIFMAHLSGITNHWGNSTTKSETIVV